MRAFCQLSSSDGFIVIAEPHEVLNVFAVSFVSNVRFDCLFFLGLSEKLYVLLRYDDLQEARSASRSSWQPDTFACPTIQYVNSDYIRANQICI